jgi:hypothetical protein
MRRRLSSPGRNPIWDVLLSALVSALAGVVIIGLIVWFWPGVMG